MSVFPLVLAALAVFPADKDTQFLLRAEKGRVVDVTGRITDLGLKGVETVVDPDYGEVLRFTGVKYGGITVPDGGRISFRDGVTVEALVYLEQDVAKGGFSFAGKSMRGQNWDDSSFGLVFEEGNVFTINHLANGNEDIDFTEDEKPNHWYFKCRARYPGRHGAAHGFEVLPVGEWVHVAWTYDAKRGLSRSWVNGSIDREGFETRCGRTGGELVDLDEAPVSLFRDAKGVKVAAIRFSSKARLLGETAPVRVFIHEKAWGTSYVHLKPIVDTIPFPVEVEVCNVTSHGGKARPNRVVWTNDAPLCVDIPEAKVKCHVSDLVVRLKKDGREFYRHQALVRNPSPTTAKITRVYRHEPPKPDGCKRSTPLWKLNADRTITLDGKPFFPLALWGGSVAGFEQAIDLGFNVISLRRPEKEFTKDQWRTERERYFDLAAAKGAMVVPEVESEREGQGFVIGMDEPWGYSFEVFRAKYFEARNGRAHPAELPMVATQNNWQRYRETAQCCDILAPDPYVNGCAPFRNILDSVKTCLADTDGRTPILPILGNYGTAKNRPDAEELRTEAYLAIIAGASGLGFYSWDDGEKDHGTTDTGRMPEQLESYRKLFAELKELAPVLTTPNAEEVETEGPRGFFGCVRNVKADHRQKVKAATYLLVASDLYRTTAKTVAAPSLAGRTLKLVKGPYGGGATETPVFDASGRAKLKLPPLSAAVYEIEK